MNGKAIKYPLSINDCFKVFDQSFNRVQYFSCIAQNLSSDGLPAIWGIQNPSGITYAIKVPENQEEEQNILHGYKHFIHRYLVRDCIESFSISLDSLFFVLLLNGKNIPPGITFQESLSNEEKGLFKKFEKAGLSSQEGKIQLLKTHFGLNISDRDKSIISCLKDIRNCLSHSNGFVRETDGKKDNDKKRKFTWQIISAFFLDEETGEESAIEFGKEMHESKTVAVRIEDHQKSFRIGEQLSFSPSETYEIAFSLKQVVNGILENINNQLNSQAAVPNKFQDAI